MTGTDLCVNIYKSVSVIFEPPCIIDIRHVMYMIQITAQIVSHLGSQMHAVTL